MTAFSEFQLTNGVLFDYADNQYPTRLYAWTDELTLDHPNSTFYGYVFGGDTEVKTPVNQYRLISGQYFCLADQVSLSGGSGIVIERIGFRGMNSIGGPIEDQGRLKYIDGCTDSLLIPPVKLGDPCLNALFFPENIDQTSHTHPSMRVGMVVAGEGVCVTDSGNYQLEPGKVFIIHEDGQHKFRTAPGAHMIVIAYHPDSDYGPVDENHPMINRTIVDGTSAAEIEEIRTR